MTVAQAIARARDALLAAGVPADEAAGDAEVLARHVLGWDLTQFALHRNDPVPADLDRAFGELIARRSRREPVSQIVGHREFWGLDFEVTRDVLTPRPETELAVQAVLDLCEPQHRHTADPIIVDIGTGSGCIAIALAKAFPAARLVASDASLAALTVARRNAARHGVSQQIAFLHTSRIPPENDVDIVVSNPPYVPLQERSALAPEVRDYEPEMALYGGEDGLDVYRRLFILLPQDLVEGGALVIEVGYDQAAAVQRLADPRFWRYERTYRDLQGIDRVLVFRTVRPRDGNYATPELLSELRRQAHEQ